MYKIVNRHDGAFHWEDEKSDAEEILALMIKLHPTEKWYIREI